MVATYTTRIRTVLEYASPAWGGLITGVQSHFLEDVQRQAVAIILGKEAQSYAKNLAKLNLPTLQVGRLQLIKRFAVKTLLSPRHYR